ncbi:MAG: DegT/DnrJ/EryC1/StrS family aminotransferase [Pirellulaceae bacterium]
MNKPTGYSIPDWPGIMPEVRDSVIAALDSGNWGRYQGQNLAQLESLLQERFSQDWVTLCSSGTIGVEFALRGIGVASGDEVILAAYDFPGNFRAIEACGATPVLIDVRPNGWTSTLDQVISGKSERTKAVLLSHLHSESFDAARIREWCDEEGVALVEDACQVPGASRDAILLGKVGHVSVFSFGGSKLLSAGRGGAVLTNDEGIHQRLKVWRDRGNDIAPLSELQAAALLPQLASLPQWQARRLEAAQHLAEVIRGHADQFLLPEWSPQESPAFYKFPLLMSEQLVLRIPRNTLCEALQQRGIPAFEGFGSFAKRSSRRCRTAMPLTNSQIAADRTILLHHPVLLTSPETIDQIGKEIVAIANRVA